MRIALIIPFGKNSTKLSNEEYFHTYIKQPEVEVIFTGTIIPGETSSDVVGGMASYVEGIVAAEKNGFDAVVTGPHPDLAIEEVRELVSIPVLGPLQVAVHIGGILGRKICVITPSESLRRWIQYRIRAYGLEHMVVTRSLGMSVEQMLPHYEEYLRSGKHGAPLDRLVSTGIRAIEEDDATVLTHGCGGMLWLAEPAGKRLKEEGFDIPFINPFPAAVEVAKSLVRLGISHGRVGYPGYQWGTTDGKPKHIEG